MDTPPHLAPLYDYVNDVFNERIAALEKLLNSFDRRYQERYEAQKESLSHALEALRATANDSKSAQAEYNKTHNDLIRQMGEQRASLQRDQMPRAEIETSLRAMDKEIRELKEVINKNVGLISGEEKTRVTSRANMMAILAVVASIISLVGLFIVVLKMLAPLAGTIAP